MTFVNKLIALKLYLISFLFLCIAFSIKAQPITVSIDTVSGNSGSQVTVSVRVSNFTNIISTQGSINFDPSIVAYSNITYFGLPGMNIGSFGLTQTSSGKISFSWMDANLTPRTLINNAILFSIQYNIIGTSGQQSAINLTGDPLAIEFVDYNIQTVIPNSVSGRIRVAGLSSSTGLTLLMRNLVGNTGSQIIMPVRALHFKEMISAQGSILFNPSVISFSSIEQIGILGMTTADFGITQVSSGIITFSWTDASLSGVSIADTSTLFAIRYNLIGTAGQQSNIDFSNTPTLIEFVDTSFNALAISTSNGNISINNNSTNNLELNFDTVYGAENAQVLISCRVRNFTNILSIQGSINFNPLVASFNSFEQFGLQDLNTSNFGSSQSSMGVLTYSWFNSLLTGVTLPNDSIIFKIRFNLIGTPGSSSSVSFSNTPTDLEVTNSIPQIISTDYSTGQINVSNFISITTGIITPTILCSGQSVIVPYTKTGAFNSGNIFTAQLSDSNGGFANPTNIGSITTTSSGSISAIIPNSIIESATYRIRVVSSNTVAIGTNNGSDLSIYNTPGLAATPTGTVSLCINPSNTIYSTTGASNAISYIWSISPIAAGSISGSGISATVDWNNTYTGNAQITVKGINNNCEGLLSNLLTVLISPSSISGSIAGSTSICLGSSTGTMTLSGHLGTINKWQKRLNLGVWTDISNTSINYSETPLTSGSWEFRAEIQSGNCALVYSTSATILVYPSSVGGSVSGSASICLGSSTGTLTLSGHIGSIIKWQKRLNAGAWTDIANTSIIFSEIPLTTGTWEYKAIIQSGTCATASSSLATIVVSPLSVGGSIAGSTSICLGNSTGTMTLSGYTGIINKWQKRLNSGTWTDISNTSATYSETPLSIGTWEYVAVLQSGTCAIASSSAATIIVSPLSVGGSIAGSTSICLGSSTGTLTLSGNIGNIIKWQKRFNSGAWIDISNSSATYSETPLSIGTWEYIAVLQSGTCASASSLSATVIVSPSSVGGNIAGSTSICLGNSTGTMTLSSYTGIINKWQKRLNSGTWTDISNTSATYSETPLSIGTWEYIAVIQSGTCASALSSSLSVVVSPLSVGGSIAGLSSICLGSSTGTLTLSGYIGAIVKWQKRLDSGVWSDISITSATYSETPLAAGTWEYKAILQSGACASVSSSTATVIVSPASVGGSIVGSASICLGSSTGTMTLSGHIGLINKWQKRLNSGAWTDIANTSITYSETPLSAGTWEYIAILQNGSCAIVSSSVATVIVSPSSVGGSIAGSTSICLGSSTGTLTLSGYTGIIVKWQKRLDLGTWTDITNTNTIYSETPLSAGTWDFRAEVKSGVCTSVFSSNVSVIVINSANIGGSLSGGNSLICFGSSTGTLTLSGHTGTIIKWQKRLNSGAWTDIANTSITYSEIPSSSGIWEYHAIVQGTSCTSNSTSSIVNVDATTVGGSIAGSASICLGSPTGTLTLSGNIGIIVKWQKRLNAGVWTDITNTSATYSETPLTAGTWEYQAILQSGTCSTASSLVATIVVSPLSVGGSIAGSTSICLGSSTGTLTLSVYTGIIVKWQKRLNLGSWTDISNTSAIYSETPLTAGTWEYKAILQSGTCASISSSVATVIVSPLSVGGSIAGSTSICLGSSSGTLTLSGYIGIIIKWQKRLNSGTWTDISNTSATYSETPISAGTWEYIAILQSGTCATASSLAATIVVSPLSVGGSIASSTSICLGSSTGTLTLSGYTGIIVKWQKRFNAGAWTDIANTSATYSEIPLTAGTWEYVAVLKSGSCATVSSSSVTIVVAPLSVGGSIAGLTSICLGSSTGILTLSGYTGNIVKWQKRLDAGAWTDITNTSATYSETPLSIGTWEYSVVLQSGSCASVSSATATVIVSSVTLGGSITGSTSICLGSSTGTLTLSGHIGIIVKWQKRLNSGPWINITNTSATYSETPISAGTWEYIAVLQSGSCATVSSASASVIVSPISVGGTISGSSNVCLGSSTGTLTLNGHTGIILKWQKRLDAGVWIDIANTSLTYSEIPLSSGTWEYAAVLQSGSCANVSSAAATVIVSPTTVGGSISGSSSICIGENTGTLTLSGNIGIVIKWQKRLNAGVWQDIVNTSAFYSEVPSIIGAWDYRAEVKSGACASEFSSEANIIVNDIPDVAQIYRSGDTLFSDIAFGNQWYNANGIILGDTNYYFVPQDSGDYYVIVTVNSCSSSSSNILHFSRTGINDFEFSKFVNVYPNPTNDAINIRIEKNSKFSNSTMLIYNGIGQVVYSIKIIDEYTTIDIKYLSKGFYFLRITNNEFDVSRIIEKN